MEKNVFFAHISVVTIIAIIGVLLMIAWVNTEPQKLVTEEDIVGDAIRYSRNQEMHESQQYTYQDDLNQYCYQCELLCGCSRK